MKGSLHGWLSTRALALVGAMLLGACVVSPQPLPPIVPTIDVAKLTLVSTGPDVVLHGDPGAVTPDATFTALGFVSTVTDSIVVAADGSFDLPLTEDSAQLYRLEAILDGERSLPIDIEAPTTAIDGPGIIPASPAYAECLTVSPMPVDDRGEVEVGQSESFAVQLQNGCTEELAVDEIRLANGAAGFTVSTAAPLSVPAGELRAVSLAFSPSKEGGAQDVLVLHLGGTSPGFVAVTLRGLGTP